MVYKYGLVPDGQRGTKNVLSLVILALCQQTVQARALRKRGSEGGGEDMGSVMW